MLLFRCFLSRAYSAIIASMCDGSARALNPCIPNFMYNHPPPANRRMAVNAVPRATATRLTISSPATLRKDQLLPPCAVGRFMVVESVPMLVGSSSPFIKV